MIENTVDTPFWGTEGQYSPITTPTLESGGVGLSQHIATSEIDPTRSGGLTYLEQVTASSCKNAPFLVGKNEKAKVAVLFRPRCKLWSCPDCRKTNADLWCLRATLGANDLLAQSRQLHLVTVTAHENLSQAQAIRFFPKDWGKLRNRWVRKCPHPQYILVPEIGKESGHFHIHFVTNQSPGTRWWKDNARACSLGYESDDTDTFDNPAKAGYYVGKYLAKQFMVDQFKKGFHRVRTSQGWPKLPALERSNDWTFRILSKLDSLHDTVQSLQTDGYRVAIADHKSAWSVVNSV